MWVCDFPRGRCVSSLEGETCAHHMTVTNLKSEAMLGLPGVKVHKPLLTCGGLSEYSPQFEGGLALHGLTPRLLLLAPWATLLLGVVCLLWASTIVLPGKISVWFSHEVDANNIFNRITFSYMKTLDKLQVLQTHLLLWLDNVVDWSTHSYFEPVSSLHSW